MDLVVTTASSQRPPNFGEGQGRPPLFCSRYHAADSSSIDVLAQDVGHMPSSTDPCFGYCFPPPQMVGVVTHLRECRAPAVIIIRSGLPFLVPISRFCVGSISPGC